MAYSKQDLLEDVFSLFRRDISKPQTGYQWNFNNYFHFIQNHPITQEQFYTLMQDLCNDGIFKDVNANEKMPPTYELTEKGEQLLWG